MPNLEILSNDPIRCGHAASVGPVDEDDAVLPEEPRHPGEGGREARRVRLLPGGPRPGHDPRDQARASRKRSRGDRGDELVESARGCLSLVRICGVGDVPEGEVRRFELDHRPFAVVNLGDEGFRVVGRDLLARALLPGRGRGRRRRRDDRVPEARLDVRPQHGQAAVAAGDAAGRGVRGEGGGRRRHDRGAGGMS